MGSSRSMSSVLAPHYRNHLGAFENHPGLRPAEIRSIRILGGGGRHSGVVLTCSWENPRQGEGGNAPCKCKLSTNTMEEIGERSVARSGRLEAPVMAGVRHEQWVGLCSGRYTQPPGSEKEGHKEQLGSGGASASGHLPWASLGAPRSSQAALLQCGNAVKQHPRESTFQSRLLVQMVWATFENTQAPAPL